LANGCGLAKLRTREHICNYSIRHRIHNLVMPPSPRMYTSVRLPKQIPANTIIESPPNPSTSTILQATNSPPFFEHHYEIQWKDCHLKTAHETAHSVICQFWCSRVKYNLAVRAVRITSLVGLLAPIRSCRSAFLSSH